MPGKKSKKEEKKTTDVISYDHIGVKECLSWDVSKKGKKSAVARNAVAENEEDQRAHFRSRKGELGKPVDRGYAMPDEQRYTAIDDSGTAGSALRGWPRHRQADEEENQEDEFPNDTCRSASKSKGKSGKSKKKGKKDDEDDKRDPWMGDLMSHRFLNDFAQQRADELEKEQKKKDAKERAAQNPGRIAKNDIKANKTSQLRSIANAQKVDVDPKDLWQMSKFKNNAQPALTTFRSGRRADQDENEKSGFVGGSGQVAPVCTCQDDTLDNHDGRAYYDDGDMEDRLQEQPAYDTARDAEY